MHSVECVAQLASSNRGKRWELFFSKKENCSLWEYCLLFSNLMTDHQLVESDEESSTLMRMLGNACYPYSSSFFSEIGYSIFKISNNKQKRRFLPGIKVCSPLSDRVQNGKARAPLSKRIVETTTMARTCFYLESLAFAYSRGCAGPAWRVNPIKKLRQNL
jgi:hypothetical protein